MEQTEKIYMISDAAKQVQVEAHVLRYWEDELKFPVKRNEMGHRYYTREDIAQFRRIKELKEQGLQLKAIRHMLENGTLKESFSMIIRNGEVCVPTQERELAVREPQVTELQTGESREQKSIRLQQLLRNMIVQAVQTNNQQMCDEIKESVVKELDYQFRMQEEHEDEREKERWERQEEHYRKIDELLRERSQKNDREKKDSQDERGKGEKQEEKQEEKQTFRKSPLAELIKKRRPVN